MTEPHNADDRRGRWEVEEQLPQPAGVLTIKPLYTMDAMHSVEELQRQIWGYGNPGAGYPYPARCLFEFAESGGLVAGAYVRDEMMGFSVAWLGRDAEGVDYLHSQLVGILPGGRGNNVGYHMKLYQRKYVKHMKLDLIKWTFDPLQSRNASLNIRKLGAVIKSYAPNYYGSLQSNFSGGLPTDRFLVEWHVNAPRVAHAIEGAGDNAVGLNECKSVTEVEVGAGGVKRLVRTRLGYDDQYLSVEIPSDFDGLCASDPAVAQDWRLKIREVFLHYFNKGYNVDDFIVEREGEAYRAFYVITKKALGSILSEVRGRGFEPR